MQDTAILDQPTLARLLDSLDGDVDFLRELIDTYLDSTPDLLAAMRLAAAAGDGPALQRAAHSLKTGSANMGGLTLAALCKRLEDLGRSGSLTEVETLVDTAAAVYDDFSRALLAWQPPDKVV